MIENVAGVLSEDGDPDKLFDENQLVDTDMENWQLGFCS
jgi:hypothetical protein